MRERDKVEHLLHHELYDDVMQAIFLDRRAHAHDAAPARATQYSVAARYSCTAGLMSCNCPVHMHNIERNTLQQLADVRPIHSTGEVLLIALAESRQSDVSLLASLQY